MTGRATEALIESLAAEARPVRPLSPPLARAAGLLLGFALLGVLLVTAFGRPSALAARYQGREALMIAENAAMIATLILAICGAFALSVPGGSRKWLVAAGTALLLWLAVGGAGCWDLVARTGADGIGRVGHGDCLLFILAGGLAAGAPLLWLLSRARPIEPEPVALLAGLGAAAAAALLLQFFHPFAVTLVDLLLHLLAVAIVVGAAALVRRRALRPA